MTENNNQLISEYRSPEEEPDFPHEKDSKRLTDIKERTLAATQGPWTALIDSDMDDEPPYGKTYFYSYGIDPILCSWEGPPGPMNCVNDAEFCAHAREDVPWLMEKLEQAEDAVWEAHRTMCWWDTPDYRSFLRMTEIACPICRRAQKRKAP